MAGSFLIRVLINASPYKTEGMIILKKFLNEFKEFALRGYVINLAVGIIIGAAFQNIVSSLTGNIISSLIGLITGLNFEAWQFSVFGAEIKYGAFVTSVINFIIMAFVIFLLVKLMNKIVSAGKKQEVKTPARKCQYCMTEIDVNATRCPACTSDLGEA